jgi:hypothetical protein
VPLLFRYGLAHHNMWTRSSRAAMTGMVSHTITLHLWCTYELEWMESPTPPWFLTHTYFPRVQEKLCRLLLRVLVSMVLLVSSRWTLHIELPVHEWKMRRTTRRDRPLWLSCPLSLSLSLLSFSFSVCVIILHFTLPSIRLLPVAMPVPSPPCHPTPSRRSYHRPSLLSNLFYNRQREIPHPKS